jgi:regulator of sigma E protease
MYVSVIISGIIMLLLAGLLVALHLLGHAFPSAASAIATLEMILLISILILVHEAGHFFAAEIFKIKVEKFAFGLPIGPILWKKNFRGVEILIHAFLFGGYVAFPDDDKDSGLPADSPERFMNRPAFQKFCVFSAGVTANVICAFLFVALTAIIWGQMPSGKYEIYIKNIVAPQSESVWQSGLEKGDKVISINDSDITIPSFINRYAQLHKKNDGKVNEISLETNYDNLKKSNPAFTREELIPKDVIIKLPKVEPERPISLNENVLKGFEKFKDNRLDLNENQKAIRDKIEVAGKNILVSDGTYTLNDIAYALSDSIAPLNIIVERNGEKITLNPIYPNTEGKIGIEYEIKEIVIPTKGPISVITTSTKYLWDKTVLLCYGLYQIFAGKIPASELHGIIAITKVGGDVINTSGFFSGLLLTAIISLDLAIMNFLPLPALDGGHVMFLIIEKIRGKKLSEETMEKIGTVFFMLLILLMILVCFNDIYALIMKKL